MSKEAMKLALEALQKIYIAPEHEEYIRVWWPACEQAITALREALAEQPEEPRAWFTVDELNAWADKKLKENPQWAEQPAQQEPEMPYTVIAGELDCSHAEELCKKLTETKGCWHTIIGTGQLKQDGSPAAWSCVMCGTSFAPKMSEKSLIDLYQVGFNNGRKSAEILSPKKHPQPAQEPVAWPCLIAEADFSADTVTLAMQCTDYKVSAGEHWLSNTPPAQRTWVGLTDERPAQQALDKMADNARELGLDYEPVQEPVAWMDRDGDLYANEPDKNWCPPHYPLYTTPPAAQPAPDLQAELEATNRQVEILSDALAESRREVAQLKSQPAPLQEPLTDEHIERIYHRYGGNMINCARAIERAVFAAQRQWVGLTGEEINAALDYWSEDERSAYGGAHAADGEYVSMIDTWRYIEAKLKEKNT